MNIFSRRHPTLPMHGKYSTALERFILSLNQHIKIVVYISWHFCVDILNEEPGSETASLLEVVRSSKKNTDHSMEYEDDFTDVEVSTAASVMTDGELKKV